MFVTVGLFVLWDRARSGGVAWSWKALLGLMLVGWGAFNLVEGVIDHHILGIHHVRTGANQLAWDLAFLALGVVLIVIGWTISRSGSRRPDVR